jgi:hypothetical protein
MVGNVTWIGKEDRLSATSILSTLGRSSREILGVWHTESAIKEDEDWVLLINEIATSTPGTLAHHALGNTQIPSRFQQVAPSFSALGWRALDPGDASLQLTAILADCLLGTDPVRAAEIASSAATAFVGIFGDDGQFLCNVDGPEVGMAMSESTGTFTAACPLTPAVAEAGVIAIGDGRVGLLWVCES